MTAQPVSEDSWDLGAWREDYSWRLTERGWALDPRKEEALTLPPGGIFLRQRTSSLAFHQDLGATQPLSHRQASPVDDVEGVQVANGTGHLGSVEPGTGLQEPALPLQVEEELEEEDTVRGFPGGAPAAGVQGDSGPSHPSLNSNVLRQQKACLPPTHTAFVGVHRISRRD